MSWSRWGIKGNLILRSKQFFFRSSTRIPVVSVGNTTWYSFLKRYKQCRLCWSRSVIKGNLLLRPKDFFVRVSHRFDGGSLSNATWYSLRIRYEHFKLDSSRSVKKGTLFQKLEKVSSVSPIEYQWCLWLIQHRTACACDTSNAN
jgi:hypothetical protein